MRRSSWDSRTDACDKEPLDGKRESVCAKIEQPKESSFASCLTLPLCSHLDQSDSLKCHKNIRF